MVGISPSEGVYNCGRSEILLKVWGSHLLSAPGYWITQVVLLIRWVWGRLGSNLAHLSITWWVRYPRGKSLGKNVYMISNFGSDFLVISKKMLVISVISKKMCTWFLKNVYVISLSDLPLGATVWANRQKN